jgi:hypothetical protein
MTFPVFFLPAILASPWSCRWMAVFQVAPHANSFWSDTIQLKPLANRRRQAQDS